MTRCANCRKPFTKLRMTMKVCGAECGEIYGRKVSLEKAEKQKRKEAKAERLDTRERKEKLKTKSDVAKELQVIVNKYIRERDLLAGYGCISCGTKSTPRWDAGHFRSIGSAAHLRFDSRNIHLQCAKCNSFLAGNLLAYKENLPERIGQKVYDELVADQMPRHYTKEDLQGLKACFREKLKELKNGRWDDHASDCRSDGI